MKKSVLLSVMGVLAASGSAAFAEEVGRVISSTPVIQQVAVPRQVCNNQPMVVQHGTSGAGSVMGGLAGGAIGNQIGHGSGRAAATVIGLVGGAMLGNSIEAQGSHVQHVQQCSTQTTYENRTLAYNVLYEYAGKEYNAQLPYDPGATIRLQLAPVGSAPAPQAAVAQASSNPNPPGTPVGVIVGMPTDQAVQPVAVAPAAYPMVYPAAYPMVQPAYYPRPYYAYPPVGLSLNFGFSSGHRHGHRHWR